MDSEGGWEDWRVEVEWDTNYICRSHGDNFRTGWLQVKLYLFDQLSKYLAPTIRYWSKRRKERERVITFEYIGN